MTNAPQTPETGTLLQKGCSTPVLGIRYFYCHIILAGNPMEIGWLVLEKQAVNVLQNNGKHTRFL